MSLSQAYRGFVAGHPDATVWHDADFLEALTAHDSIHDWSAAELIVEGELVGVLPLCTKKRLDGLVITTPPLARYCSPLFVESYSDRVGMPSAICELFNVLPKGYVSLDQQWHPSLFADASTSSCVELRELPTYKLDLPSTLEEVLLLPKKRTRRTLRAADKHWTLRQENLDEKGLALLKSPFERQNIPVPFDPQVVLSVFQLLSSKGKAVCHYAYDPEDKLQGATICIYDSQTAYCWLAGSSAEARANSCGSFLLAAEIKWAFNHGLKEVDFLGSALPGPAANRKQLGGVKHHYPHVFSDTNFMTKALRTWRMRK